MKILKTFFMIGAFMFIALIYVHQRVELVKLSYTIESRQKGVSLLLDQREKLVYNLNHLTSPSGLERVLVARKVEIEYPRRDKVIRVASRTAGVQGSRSVRLARASQSSKDGFFHNLLDLIGMTPEAQAMER